MKKTKKTVTDFLSRFFIHWKTSLIGAIEGSGLLTAGIISGSNEVRKVAIIVSAYLFIKGLISEDVKK